MQCFNDRMSEAVRNGLINRWALPPDSNRTRVAEEMVVRTRRFQCIGNNSVTTEAECLRLGRCFSSQGQIVEQSRCTANKTCIACPDNDQFPCIALPSFPECQTPALNEAQCKKVALQFPSGQGEWNDDFKTCTVNGVSTNECLCNSITGVESEACVRGFCEIPSITVFDNCVQHSCGLPLQWVPSLLKCEAPSLSNAASCAKFGGRWSPPRKLFVPPETEEECRNISVC